MPPATAAEPTMKARRERLCKLPISLLRHLCRSRMDCSANARIGSATTQIAGHHLVDLLVRRLGDQFKKRDRLHDLAGLAVAALRNLVFDPSRQNRVLVSIRQPFDRDHRLAGDAADFRLTGTDSLSVYLDGAGATLRYPAAVLGTRDTELVAQHPKQRHLRNDVNLVLDPVDREVDHVGISLRDVCRPAAWARSDDAPHPDRGKL